MLTVLITITTSGSDVCTEFNLFSNATGYITAFETGISLVSLLGGFTSTNVPDETTIIKLVPVGERCLCTDPIFLSVVFPEGLQIPVAFDPYPPTDEGEGSNPRVEYWSSGMIGGVDDIFATVQLTATETSHTGGSGQLYISIDPEADFSLKVWHPIIGFSGTNPYTVIAGIPIYFQVIAGSSPGDTTTIEVEITYVNISTIGSPSTLTLTSTT